VLNLADLHPSSMSSGTIATASISAGLPMLAALAHMAGAPTLPDGAPWWLVLLFSAGGPVVTWALVLGGRVFARVLRAWASEKRAEAARMLADKDPKNDGEAVTLKLQASAADAAADVLEQGNTNPGRK